MKVATLFLMAIVGLSSAVSPSDILDLRELSEQRMEELFDGLVRLDFCSLNLLGNHKIHAFILSE